MVKLKCTCGEILDVELTSEPFKLCCKNSNCNNLGLVSKDNVMNFIVMES